MIQQSANWSTTHSHEWQDFFIASVTDKKTNGTYLEIGASCPTQASNTYLLETKLNWRGIAIELDRMLASQHKRQRKNPCICADATRINYSELLEQHNLGPHIDYLQLDIDPPDQTFNALTQIDFKKYSFSVITYEHDYYANPEYNNKWRQQSREFFENYGYTRVVSDVIPNDQLLGHEDWYVNEKYMTSDAWRSFVGSDVRMHRDSSLMDQYYKQLFSKYLNYDLSN
jgi:hypothetical protein